MPAQLNAKGPGEFIRDHLQEPQTGGRDYVGSIYQAYKEYLRSVGHPQALLTPHLTQLDMEDKNIRCNCVL